MAIPGPGTAISINTIVGEFGGTVPHSLSEYYRGGGLVPNTPGNAAIPTSGTIPMGSFYGSANRTPVTLTIAANTYNYDVYANRGPSYVAGASDITVTVNPGVTVGSTAIPTYAMLVPSAFNPADTVTIVNNGVIQAMGGTGGNGGSGTGPGSAGSTGGSTIYVNRPTIITNNGVVAAGGGGGGGGGGRSVTNPQPPKIGPPTTSNYGGGGGGGGAGFNGGSFGTGGAGGAPGSVGTSPAGGAGGAGSTGAGPGGAGGGRGAAGTAGTPSSGTGGAGGATGNYIVGNPFVTWPVTGTRQGNVA